MKKLGLLALTIGCCTMIQAKERTVYVEEFDRLGDYVASFNEGASITEAPASLKALSFTPKSLSLARRGFFSISESPSASDYTIHFVFRPYSAKKQFNLKFFFGDPEKSAVSTLSIDERGSYFDGNKPPTPADGMAGFPNQAGWNKGAIVVRSGKASLYLFRNGILTQEAAGNFPAGKLIGWNLESENPLAIDSVRIVDDSARPYMIGDPIMWLNDSGKKVGGKLSLAPLPKSAHLITSNASEVPFTHRPYQDLCIKYLPKAAEKGPIVAKINLKLADDTMESLAIVSANTSVSVENRVFDSASDNFVSRNENIVLTNSHYEISSRSFRIHNRIVPQFQWRYEGREILEIVANRDKLPSTLTTPLTMRIAPIGDSILTNNVWIDGKFAGKLALSAPIKSITAATLSPGAEVAIWPTSAEIFPASLLLPLNVEALNRPYGTVPPLKNPRTDTQFPYQIASSTSALNLAYNRENLGTFALECNGYLSRSAFDGMPSSMHFSVPVAQYTHVHALCAVDPNSPADFIPTVTARLTHYANNGGRSQAACESTRLLPKNGEELPEGVTLYCEEEGGFKVYDVRFDFDIGSIQDLTSMLNLDHLDLDFVGALWDKDTYYVSRKRSPSYEKQSSVQIYAATLEKAPVEMVVTPYRKNSTYYPNEKPGATVTLTPSQGRENLPYCVTIEVFNSKNELVKTETIKGNGAAEKSVDFGLSEIGYYSVKYTLATSTRRDSYDYCMTHEGSFALLPADTRQATAADSPYYVWNFGGAHGTPSKLEDFGDMLKRMGVRRTLLNDRFGGETNDAVKAYMLTVGEFPFYRLNKKAAQTEAEAFEDLKKLMRQRMALYPSCRSAIIFHESGGGPFPMELLGGKTEISQQQKERDIARVREAITTAKAWREVDPGIRLIIGNSGNSLGLLAQLFRENFPKELIDAMGDETVGMTQPPERSVAYPAWALKKLAEIYGYDCVPDAPWEWKSNVFRHQGGEENDAAGKVRNALIAHAWRYTCVPLSGITEMANSYYDTIWGDSTFTRWPLAYPHQAFLAQSTLTQILDLAKFVRMVPTGSITTYCLEFEKVGGEKIYALWTARSALPVKLDFGKKKAKSLTQISMLGSEKPFDEKNLLEISSVPCYLKTKSKLESIAIEPSALEKCEGRPAEAKVIQPLHSKNEVTIRRGVEKRIELGHNDQPFAAFHREGTFSLEDGENSVKLINATKGDCPELMQEYTFLKINDPKPIESPISTIGLYAKGNSSWGKIYFEITDSEGEVWFSGGTGGYGCTVYDWPEKLSLNFDGWQFLSFPLTADSPIKVYSPGENEWQWQRDGEKGNGKLDYPIKVTGIAVGTYPKALNLMEMEETSPVIELREISAY